MIKTQSSGFMKRQKDADEKLFVLVLQWQSESVDDAERQSTDDDDAGQTI